MTFDGETTFIFRVKNSTKNFVLHSVELDISKTELYDENATLIPSTLTYNNTFQQIVSKLIKKK